jgi:hypothetical protein
LETIRGLGVDSAVLAASIEEAGALLSDLSTRSLYARRTHRDEPTGWLLAGDMVETDLTAEAMSPATGPSFGPVRRVLNAIEVIAHNLDQQCSTADPSHLLH